MGMYRLEHVDDHFGHHHHHHHHHHADMPTMTASFPSSLSWRRCALPRSKRFTLSLSLASTKSLHRRTSTFFGATDNPSRTIQEIAGFIEIHSRDRGRWIACLVYLELEWWGGRGLRRTQAPTTPPTT